MGKTLAKVVFVALSLPFAIACSDQTKACTEAGCFDGIRVVLEPDVGSAYDADLVLDGVAGSFTCTESNGGSTLTNSAGSAP